MFQANVPVGLTGPQALFVVVEAHAIEAVLAGTPIAPAFPAGFATPAPGPIPAIISRSLADTPRGVKLGDTFTSSIEGYNLKYRVVEVARRVPGGPARTASSSSSPASGSSAQAPPARIVPGLGARSAPRWRAARSAMPSPRRARRSA